jgi:predicted dehydrogenase
MRFMVVGLGSMGRRRIRNLRALQAGEVIGYDPRPDRREEARSRYGIATVAGVDEGLAREAGALIISTPPDAHLEYARLAARNGLHFFVEAGVDAAGYDELAAECARRGTVAAPSCTMRFHPSVRKIRDLVASGAIGEVAGFTHHCGQYLPDWHPWEDYRDTYFAKRATGACREIVAFELGWLTWVCGPIDALSSLQGKRSTLEADIDDVYQLVLRFRSGALGHLLVDAITRVPTRRCRLFSEAGIVDWDAAARAVRLYRPADREWTTFPEPEPIREPGYQAGEDMYIEEMRHFVRAVRGEAPFGYSLAEDGRVIEALHAAERSSARGRHVSLPA